MTEEEVINKLQDWIEFMAEDYGEALTRDRGNPAAQESAKDFEAILLWIEKIKKERAEMDIFEGRIVFSIWHLIVEKENKADLLGRVKMLQEYKEMRKWLERKYPKWCPIPRETDGDILLEKGTLYDSKDTKGV